jgi:hypothetical protein
MHYTNILPAEEERHDFLDLTPVQETNLEVGFDEWAEKVLQKVRAAAGESNDAS